MIGFLFLAYCVGASVTSLALAVRVLVLSIHQGRAMVDAAIRGEPDPGWYVPSTWDDTIRAAIWPIYLWRPW